MKMKVANVKKEPESPRKALVEKKAKANIKAKSNGEGEANGAIKIEEKVNGNWKSDHKINGKAEKMNIHLATKLSVVPIQRQGPKGNQRKRLRDENKFITDLLSLMVFPKLPSQTNESESEGEDDNISDPRMKKPLNDGTKRATSFGELHERLQHKLDELRGNKKANGKKTKLSKAEKKLKAKQEKRLKAKMAKKPAAAGVGTPSAKAEPDEGNEVNQAAKKKAGGTKMAFSKFDFNDDIGIKIVEKPQTLDPKSTLARLQKHKEKIKDLEAKGKSDKAQAIEEKTAWKTALDRSSGLKVKDDPTLLKKSIKKLERKKKVSKKKWETRLENEEKRKNFKQTKRRENLNKRKIDKKEMKKGRSSKK